MTTEQNIEIGDEMDYSIKDMKLEKFGILSQLSNDPNSHQPARNKVLRPISEEEIKTMKDFVFR